MSNVKTAVLGLVTLAAGIAIGYAAHGVDFTFTATNVPDAAPAGSDEAGQPAEDPATVTDPA